MIDHTEQATSTWVFEYVTGYDTYMWKFYSDLYANAHLKFVIPPQRIGGRIGIRKSSKLLDSYYRELVKITDDFCDKYADPKGFPKVW